MIHGEKTRNFASRLSAAIPTLLSILLLGACGKSTNEIPIGQVGLSFTIKLETTGSSNGGDVSHGFHMYGNIFTIEEGQERKLRLARTERLTISDGVHEYDLYAHYPMFAENFFFYFPDSEPFQRDAPYYVLRYYRRDGEVLESRIETPALMDFIAPEIDVEWLPREQVLGVEWRESLVRVQEVALDSRCRVPDENGKTVMYFPAFDFTQLDIDLTAAQHKDACETRNTYIRLVQAPVSASSIDSRFLVDSRFELQRHRVRSIRERT